MVLFIGLIIGIFLGMFIFRCAVNQYFDQNEKVIKWRGRTYVLVNKLDFDDSDIN